MSRWIRAPRSGEPNAGGTFAVQVYCRNKATGAMMTANVRTDGAVPHGPEMAVNGGICWSDFTEPGFNVNADWEGFDGGWMPVYDFGDQVVELLLTPKSVTPIPPEPPTTKPPRLTGEALLHVAGNMCGLYDGLGSGNKSTIYTPVMPSVFVRERDRFDLWCEKLKADGSTHVLFNYPAEGGPSYGGVWDQPEFGTPEGMKLYRECCDVCLDRGLAPMVWLDYGGSDPIPRINKYWPVFKDGTVSIHEFMIGIMSCEPVIGDWSSYEVSEGLKLQTKLMPKLAMGYHGSPQRLVGSSNPVEENDPWQGDEPGFYRDHGGGDIKIAFYQTPHGKGNGSIYQPCTKHSKEQLDRYECTCWVSRFWEYLIRLAGGYKGWRMVKYCLLETITYEYIRHAATEADARNVATMGQQIAAMYGLKLGQGNGLPW